MNPEINNCRYVPVKKQNNRWFVLRRDIDGALHFELPNGRADKAPRFGFACENDAWEYAKARANECPPYTYVVVQSIGEARLQQPVVVERY